MLFFLCAALYIFIFIIGSCIGSFLNVVIYRLPKKISVAKGRSFCPSCNHTLSPLDLVPIFSWAFLGGKCHYCKCRISPRYALGEALTGAFAVFSVVAFDFTWQAAIVFVACCLLYCIFWIDQDTMEIPNALVIALIIPAVCSVFVFKDISLLSRAIGFFEISAPMLVMALVIKGSFGGGDIKLCAVVGFLLGWKNMLAGSFFALILAGGYAIIALAKKNKAKGDHFAFGPFLATGFVIAIFLGDAVTGAYSSLFGL